MSDTDAVIIEYRISPLVEGWVTEGKLMATLAAWSMIPSAGAPAITISKRVTVLGQEPETEVAVAVRHAPGKVICCLDCRAKGYMVCRNEPAANQSCDRCSHGCASCECTCPEPVCGDRDPVSDKPCLRSPGHGGSHRDQNENGTETCRWWNLDQIL